MLLMFTTLIAGATFAAVFSGFIVQKIPFTVLCVAVYVYLFITVSGSLARAPVRLRSSRVARPDRARRGALIVLRRRFFWRRATKQRERLKSGGAILGQPRRFLIGVALPRS